MSTPVGIGIVCPLWREAPSLVERVRGQRFVQLDGALVCISGVGRECAGGAARDLLERGARALVSWGVAGALDPTLRPGDLLLPARILAADSTEYTSEPHWRARIEQRLGERVSVCNEPLLESEEVLAGPSQKRDRQRATGAAAVDMESATVALAAQAAAVPFLAARAICDSVQMTVPECALRGVDAAGQVHLGRLLASLIRDPRQLPHLLRLQRSFRAALTTLRGVARELGPGLLASHLDDTFRNQIHADGESC